MNKNILALCASALALLAATTATAQELKLNSRFFKSADEEIAAATKQAKAAIQNCDGPKFEDALEWLDDIAYDVSDSKADQIDGIMDNLEDEWADKLCGWYRSDRPFINLTGSVGQIKFNNGPAYLGKENGGTINTLKFLEPDDTGDYYQIAAKFSLAMMTPNWPNMSNWPNGKKKNQKWELVGGFSHARADYDKSYTNVNTGGDVLLIPGVGSGANGAGFSLAYAGGLNDITSARYDAEYDKSQVWLGNAVSWDYGKTQVKPMLGFGYSYQDSEMSFGGSIPGYSRDFRYDTDINTHSFGPRISLELSRELMEMNTGKDEVPLEIYGTAGYGLNYNMADGRDSLAFTGFATQSIDIDKNQFTNDFSLGAGVRLNPKGALSVSLVGEYQHEGNAPVIKRSGAGFSKIEFEDTDAFLVGLQVRHSF